MATATLCFFVQGHLILLGVASEVGSSVAVTFCRSEQGLPVESLTLTVMCVRWLAVAECRPGPLTWHV